jgi:hypothetical protein
MPAFQQKFNLIPENPSNAAAKPPMTSKAAKKAYLKANRGPKVTRAEQRRLEKEELEKQKKEHDKERNAARAKAVREKKAAKAAEEKEQRRKLGIPEPNRFVRASQPTISTFARHGGKRAWQEITTVNITEELEDATVEDDLQPMDMAEPPGKRIAVEQESDDEFGCFPSMSQADELLGKINSSSISVSQNKENSQLSSLSENRNLRHFSATRAKSQTELTEDVASPNVSRHSKPLHFATAASKPVKEAYALKSATRRDSQELPKLKTKQSFDETPLRSQALADLITTQLQTEAAEAKPESDRLTCTPILQMSAVSVATGKCTNTKPNLQNTNSRATYQHAYHSPTETIRFSKASLPQDLARSPPSQAARSLKYTQNVPTITTVSKPTFRKPNAFMPPPPKPSTFTRPPYLVASHNSGLVQPRKVGGRALQQTEDIPPTATQLFIENNLDDFLPSPSQEARELLDDDIEDFPSNTQIAKELSPARPCFKPNIEVFDDSFQDLFCTQDVTMSSQELLDITTPSRPPPARSMNRRLYAAPQLAKRHEAPRRRLPLQSSSGNIGRPTTANTVSRSDNTPKQSSAAIAKVSPDSAKNIPRALPIIRAPNVDTECSHGDVVQHNSQNLSTAREMPPPIPPKIPLDPKPKRRFFQEKEEDIFQAAIYESKKLECNRMAQEKARQSKLETKNSVPVPRKRNTIKRAQSNATDYDDEDFLSSQELLALY